MNKKKVEYYHCNDCEEEFNNKNVDIYESCPYCHSDNIDTAEISDMYGDEEKQNNDT